MLKKNVIKKNFEFQDIIHAKKQKVSKYLVAYTRKNQSELRIGISVSKKFANAVNRNKYRRKVRNILDELNMWSIKMDVVLILRKAFLNLTFIEMRKEIKSILERI
ncbi:MAG: ribonuclease P protein component [Mycoplasmataceae bacterium]|nr:ribonuclease P protein component [Mycoplasmataceae bacterium]